MEKAASFHPGQSVLKKVIELSCSRIPFLWLAASMPRLLGQMLLLGVVDVVGDVAVHVVPCLGSPLGGIVNQ